MTPNGRIEGAGSDNQRNGAPVHWTQTPEGREKMRQIQFKSAAKRKRNRLAQLAAPKPRWNQTPEGRKKQAEASRKMWARIRSEAANAEPPRKVYPSEIARKAFGEGPKTGGYSGVRELISELAREGALARLKRNEEECKKLRVFLGLPIPDLSYGTEE